MPDFGAAADRILGIGPTIPENSSVDLPVLIDKYARKHGIPNPWFQALVDVETGGNPKARPHVLDDDGRPIPGKYQSSARGLGQVLGPALKDYNEAHGTNYRPRDLENPDIGLDAAGWYWQRMPGKTPYEKSMYYFGGPNQKRPEMFKRMKQYADTVKSRLGKFGGEELSSSLPNFSAAADRILGGLNKNSARVGYPSEAFGEGPDFSAAADRLLAQPSTTPPAPVPAPAGPTGRDPALQAQIDSSKKAIRTGADMIKEVKDRPVDVPGYGVMLPEDYRKGLADGSIKLSPEEKNKVAADIGIDVETGKYVIKNEVQTIKNLATAGALSKTTGQPVDYSAVPPPLEEDPIRPGSFQILSRIFQTPVSAITNPLSAYLKGQPLDTLDDEFMSAVKGEKLTGWRDVYDTFWPESSNPKIGPDQIRTALAPFGITATDPAKMRLMRQGIIPESPFTTSLKGLASFGTDMVFNPWNLVGIGPRAAVELAGGLKLSKYGKEVLRRSMMDMINNGTEQGMARRLAEESIKLAVDGGENRLVAKGGVRIAGLQMPYTHEMGQVARKSIRAAADEIRKTGPGRFALDEMNKLISKFETNHLVKPWFGYIRDKQGYFNFVKANRQELLDRAQVVFKDIGKAERDAITDAVEAGMIDAPVWRTLDARHEGPAGPYYTFRNITPTDRMREAARAVKQDQDNWREVENSLGIGGGYLENYMMRRWKNYPSVREAAQAKFGTWMQANKRKPLADITTLEMMDLVPSLESATRDAMELYLMRGMSSVRAQSAYHFIAGTLKKFGRDFNQSQDWMQDMERALQMGYKFSPRIVTLRRGELAEGKPMLVNGKWEMPEGTFADPEGGMPPGGSAPSNPFDGGGAPPPPPGFPSEPPPPPGGPMGPNVPPAPNNGSPMGPPPPGGGPIAGPAQPAAGPISPPSSPPQGGGGAAALTGADPAQRQAFDAVAQAMSGPEKSVIRYAEKYIKDGARMDDALEMGARDAVASAINRKTGIAGLGERVVLGLREGPYSQYDRLLEMNSDLHKDGIPEWLAKEINGEGESARARLAPPQDAQEAAARQAIKVDIDREYRKHEPLRLANQDILPHMKDRYWKRPTRGYQGRDIVGGDEWQDQMQWAPPGVEYQNLGNGVHVFVKKIRPSEFLEALPVRMLNKEVKPPNDFAWGTRPAGQLAPARPLNGEYPMVFQMQNVGHFPKLLKEMVNEGKAFAPPRLQVKWDEKSQMWMNVGHEGRGRTLNYLNLFGDQPMEVHFTVLGDDHIGNWDLKRAERQGEIHPGGQKMADYDFRKLEDDLTPEQMAAPMIPEWRRNPENFAPGGGRKTREWVKNLQEDWIGHKRAFYDKETKDVEHFGPQHLKNVREGMAGRPINEADDAGKITGPWLPEVDPAVRARANEVINGRNPAQDALDVKYREMRGEMADMPDAPGDYAGKRDKFAKYEEEARDLRKQRLEVERQQVVPPGDVWAAKERAKAAAEEQARGQFFMRGDKVVMGNMKGQIVGKYGNQWEVKFENRSRKMRVHPAALKHDVPPVAPGPIPGRITALPDNQLVQPGSLPKRPWKDGDYERGMNAMNDVRNMQGDVFNAVHRALGKNQMTEAERLIKEAGGGPPPGPAGSVYGQDLLAAGDKVRIKGGPNIVRDGEIVGVHQGGVSDNFANGLARGFNQNQPGGEWYDVRYIGRGGHPHVKVVHQKDLRLVARPRGGGAPPAALRGPLGRPGPVRAPREDMASAAANGDNPSLLRAAAADADERAASPALNPSMRGQNIADRNLEDLIAERQALHGEGYRNDFGDNFGGQFLEDESVPGPPPFRPNANIKPERPAKWMHKVGPENMGGDFPPNMPNEIDDYRKMLKWMLPGPIADDMLTVADPSEASALWRGYDRITGAFKTSLTIPFPAFHVRNSIGNIANAFLDMGIQALNPFRHMQAIDIMAGKSGSILTETGERYTYEQIRKMFRNEGLEGAFHGRLDLIQTPEGQILGAKAQPFWRSLARAASGRDTIRNVHPIQRAGQFFGENIEQEARMHLFIAELRRGSHVEAASRRVRQVLFDYDNLTAFEKRWMRRAIPFYTWTRKNIPFQMRKAIENPGRSAALMSIYAMHGDQQMIEQEMRNYPPYQSHRLGRQIGYDHEGNPLWAISYGLPIEDLARFWPQVRGTENRGGEFLRMNFLAMMHPLFRAIIEEAANKDLYLDRPLDELNTMYEIWGKALEQTPEFVRKSVDFKIEHNGRGDIVYKMNPRALHLVRSFILSRIYSTTGKAFDTRKDWVTRALNTLTGVDVTSIDLETQILPALRNRSWQRKETSQHEKEQQLGWKRFGGEQPEHPFEGPSVSANELLGKPDPLPARKVIEQMPSVANQLQRGKMKAADMADVARQSTEQ